MSRDFLENRLFRAFSQENELANGTGLGMSLVAKLVRGFNGRIKVQSAKGQGTTMTVSMPIDIALQQENKPQNLLPARHGMNIGFLNPGFSNEESIISRRKLQTSAIMGACSRLGMTLTEPEAADINFAFEADLPGLIVHPKFSTITAPIIVLCDNVMSAANMRSSSSTRTREKRLEFVAQPFGPQQLSTAIARCVDSKPSPVLSQAEIQSKAATSREALKLQLSRRSHTTGLSIQTPMPIRPPLVRAGSAPPLSWSALSLPFCTDSLPGEQIPSPQTPTPTPLNIAVPSETPYTNGRTQYFKEAFEEVIETNGTADKLVTPSPNKPADKLSLLLVDDNVSFF